MDAALVLRGVRRRAGWSLRRLADLAHTSHATLAAYEGGRVVPGAETLERIVRSAGYELEPAVVRTIPAAAATADRERELLDVLELAEQFPARHSRTLQYPRFGRA
jgi:transcriptional regulator with XRE-family HTH domain